MSALSEFQFEIVPDVDAMDGFVFGIGAKVSVNNEGFDSGEQSWLTQDSQNSRRGVKRFGRDVRSNRSWTWASHVNEVDVESALDTLEQMVVQITHNALAFLHPGGGLLGRAARCRSNAPAI